MALILALALPACGGGDDGGEATPVEQTRPAQTAATEAAEPITMNLREVNKSGQSGAATLIRGTVGEIVIFDVQIEIEPAVASPQMAHVHGVTCAESVKIKGFNQQLATVHSELSEVRGGKSESRNVPGSITTGEFSINVHKPAHPYPAVACGDIPNVGE